MSSDVEISKLVLYYEDDCLQCKELKKILKQLATEFKGKRLLVMQINMSRNELQGLNLPELPLLVLQKTLSDKSSAVFKGEHSFEIVKHWLVSTVYIPQLLIPQARYS